MAATVSGAVQGMTEAELAVAFPGYERGVSFAAVPSNLRVACSNPSGGIRNRVRGECVYPQSSADGHFEIWVSPKLDDVETVMLVLLHELVHAALHSWAPGAGHGPRFWRLAKPLGFARPLTTATIAACQLGVMLRRRLSGWQLNLGDYPHAGVNFAAHDAQRRRQSTRMLKAECLADGCGFKVRMTRTWAAQATPLCPVCEGIGVHSRTVVAMAEGDDLCQLAGVTVSRTGEDDAEAVERAAVLKAEREERARAAAEAAAEAVAEAARLARREAAASTAAAAQRTANARAAGLGEAADLGMVEGQGVANPYGTPGATRMRRAAERAALPLPAFDGVAAGVATVRHLIALALPGCTPESHDVNEVEDAVRVYCGRNGIRPPARFPLAEAHRAADVAAPAAAVTGRPAARKSARFANLDLD